MTSYGQKQVVIGLVSMRQLLTVRNLRIAYSLTVGMQSFQDCFFMRRRKHKDLYLVINTTVANTGL